MNYKKIYTEAVNFDKKTEFYRYIHEVMTEDGMTLIMTQKIPLHQKPLAPIMFVHGLGQNRFTWTQSRRSMENYFVSKGFQTFNLELRGHGLSRANGSDYPRRFETYLHYDLPAFIKAINEITNGQKIFYIGHSLGGTISYCISSQFQDYFAGIISIGGPFQMAKGNRLLQAISKIGVTIDKNIPVIRNLYPKTFYIDYLGFLVKYGLFFIDTPLNQISLQVWYPGSIERDILLERIEKGFDRTGFNVLGLLLGWAASGKFLSSDGKMNYEENISNYKNPILFIVGDCDYVVPLDAIKEGYEKAASEDKTLKIFGGECPGLYWGHIDLINGKEAPLITWPYMLDWMKKRIF